MNFMWILNLNKDHLTFNDIRRTILTFVCIFFYIKYSYKNTNIKKQKYMYSRDV